MSLSAAGSLASGRLLFAASLLLSVVAYGLIEAKYEVSFVRVGAESVGLDMGAAYLIGLVSALAAMIVVALLFGSRETALAFSFYSQTLARCLFLVVAGSASFGAGPFLLLFAALAGGSGDLRGSFMLVVFGFLDYLVLSLVFFGLTLGFSEARLLAAILVFARVVTPPLKEAWFASPELAVYSYLRGWLSAPGFGAYVGVYGALGTSACRVLAGRG